MAQTSCSAGPRPRSSTRPRSGPRRTRRGSEPALSRSRPTRPDTARSRTSSPPVSTGSRSPRGLVTATCARPGTVTATSSRAARTKPGSASTPSSTPPSNPDCGARPHKRRNPREYGGPQYRYRDSNCVAHPITPVFIGFLRPISPAGGSWGQPETGHAAPKMPPVLPPVSGGISSRPGTLGQRSWSHAAAAA